MVIRKHKSGIKRYAPELISVIFGMGNAMFFVAARQYVSPMNPKLEKLDDISFVGACSIMGAFLGGVSYMGLNHFLNWDWREMIFGFRYLARMDDKEKQIELCKEAIRKDSQYGQVSIIMGELLLKKRRYAEALECYRRGFEANQFSRSYIFGHQRAQKVFNWIVSIGNRLLIRKKEGTSDLDYCISKAMSETVYGQKDAAEKKWEDILSMDLGDQQRMELEVLCALSLETLGDHEKAAEVRRRAIGKMMETGDFEIRGESRNEVMRYQGSRFISNTFLGKRSCEQDLEDKIRRLEEEGEHLEELRKRRPHQVARSYGIMGRDSAEPVHVISYDGESLDEIVRLNEKQTYRAIQEAIDILADIHANKKGGTTEKSYFIERIKEVGVRQIATRYHLDDVLEEGVLGEIEEGCTKVSQILAGATHAFYRDANLRNWSRDSVGNIVAFDLEGGRYLPVQLDLVSLLEFGREYLTQREIKKLVKYYMKQYKHYSGERLDEKAFWKQYEAARVQRHFELAGYRARDATRAKEKGKQEEATKNHAMMLFHLESTKEAAQKLLGKRSAMPIERVVDKLYERVRYAA